MNDREKWREISVLPPRHDDNDGMCIIALMLYTHFVKKTKTGRAEVIKVLPTDDVGLEIIETESIILFNQS